MNKMLLNKLTLSRVSDHVTMRFFQTAIKTVSVCTSNIITTLPKSPNKYFNIISSLNISLFTCIYIIPFNTHEASKIIFSEKSFFAFCWSTSFHQGSQVLLKVCLFCAIIALIKFWENTVVEWLFIWLRLQCNWR